MEAGKMSMGRVLDTLKDRDPDTYWRVVDMVGRGETPGAIVSEIIARLEKTNTHRAQRGLPEIQVSFR
jgi:hypothetical protein